jgi:hypothetical protein
MLHKVISQSCLFYSMHKCRHPDIHLLCTQKKSKTISATRHKGLQGCETSRLPHFLVNWLTESSEVVSLIHQPPFTPQKDSRSSFLLEAECTPGRQCGQKDLMMQRTVIHPFHLHIYGFANCGAVDIALVNCWEVCTKCYCPSCSTVSVITTPEYLMAIDR